MNFLLLDSSVARYETVDHPTHRLLFSPKAGSKVDAGGMVDPIDNSRDSGSILGGPVTHRAVGVVWPVTNRGSGFFHAVRGGGSKAAAV